ncbi:hypothetical protein D1007_14569 [Hordeum vulgare]|nr:hypothetical protein D1007_14569 [Hordeum vulgare]
MDEITERRHGRDEGGIIVLSNNDEEATTPTKPVCSGYPRKGCSKDDDDPWIDDDGDDVDDYTGFYRLLDMN